MREFTSIWQVTPETAHPRAKQLLGDSIVWNFGDQDSPLGNYIGADTFAAYLVFRRGQIVGGIQDFLQGQLAWGGN